MEWLSGAVLKSRIQGLSGSRDSKTIEKLLLLTLEQKKALMSICSDFALHMQNSTPIDSRGVSVHHDKRKCGLANQMLTGYFKA